jgi:hypothetical protein
MQGRKDMSPAKNQTSIRWAGNWITFIKSDGAIYTIMKKDARAING